MAGEREFQAPLLGLLPPGPIHGRREGWMLTILKNRASTCIGGFLNAMKRMRLHFPAFHAFPHELHTVFMNLFCMRLCIPLLVHWCVCLCLTKCPHDTQIQQCVNKDSASKCSISPHLQLNHRFISWNSLKKNASRNKFFGLFVCFFKDN